MRVYPKLTILVLLALLVVSVGSALAQEGELAPCEGTQVSGTVVAVDEATMTATVDTGEGLCTVTLADGTYTHPIVALLGAYFDDVSAESLMAALETLNTSVVCAEDESGSLNCEISAESDPAAQQATVVAITANEDGTFTLELAVEGQEEHLFITIADAELAAELEQALETLEVSWELNEDGVVVEVGDEIAAYHEEGLGFGVLVKLYAMVQESQEACAEEEVDPEEPCGVTVEELVAAFESGTGMGELFQQYGMPSVIGVGHVIQESNGVGKPDWAGRPDWAGPPWAADSAEDEDEGEGPGGPPPWAGPPGDDGSDDGDGGPGGPPPWAGPPGDDGSDDGEGGQGGPPGLSKKP